MKSETQHKLTIPIKLHLAAGKLLKCMAAREFRSARKQLIVCVLEACERRHLDPELLLDGTVEERYAIPPAPKIPPLGSAVVTLCRLARPAIMVLDALAKAEGHTMRMQATVCIFEAAKRRGINIDRVLAGKPVTYVAPPDPKPCHILEDASCSGTSFSNGSHSVPT
ncbi:MAG: hypothetical protein AB1508_18920 [Pseudomonadota bacterium]